MATTKEVIPFYRLALEGGPGMKDQARHDMKILCKTGLLVTMCIDQVVAVQPIDPLLKEISTEEDLNSLEVFKSHVLEKSQLERLHEKLKAMASVKEMFTYFGFILDSGPGMNSSVKLDIKISTRIALLLVVTLDRGSAGADFRKLIGGDGLELIDAFKKEVLKKADLEKTYEILIELTKPKE
ncbi:MAG: hypothetical protein P4L51_28580 [Puia sp.]|nr:hypothetical protein [Puia sp.]